MFQRTARIEPESDSGRISGVIATDGEASDGHILNIKGIQAKPGAPLLFGHDDYTGRSNLGSWLSFRKSSEGSKLGDNVLRGAAQIELEGAGGQADFRNDMAHMIAKGHIGQFSIRWDSIGEPQRRINLPSDHPAYVDEKSLKGFNDPRRWGRYFEKSRLLEASVVTIGADPGAIIGRCQEGTSESRQLWGRALMQLHGAQELPEEMDEIISLIQEGVQRLKSQGIDDFGTILRSIMNTAEMDPIEMVRIQRDDMAIVVPRWAREQMLAESEQMLKEAIQLHVATSAVPEVMERAAEEAVETDEPQEEVEEESTEVTERSEPTEEVDDAEADVTAPEEPARTVDVTKISQELVGINDNLGEENRKFVKDFMNNVLPGRTQ